MSLRSSGFPILLPSFPLGGQQKEMGGRDEENLGGFLRVAILAL